MDKGFTHFGWIQVGPNDIQNSVSLEDKQFCSSSIAGIVSKGEITELALVGLNWIRNEKIAHHF